MDGAFDFSQMLEKTRAIQVILDRPRSLRFDLRAMTDFEAHYGKNAREWLKEFQESKKEPTAEDVYYVSWLGLHSTDELLTQEEFQKLAPWPVTSAIFYGPALQALTGFVKSEKN